MHKTGNSPTERDMIRCLDCYSAHLIKWLVICGLIFFHSIFSLLFSGMQASAPPSVFKYKTQTSFCLLKIISTLTPYWNMEYFQIGNRWETEQLHWAAAILSKLREVVMCNYNPNSQFNSHNHTIQAVTAQKMLAYRGPHLQRLDRWRTEGNF